MFVTGNLERVQRVKDDDGILSRELVGDDNLRSLQLNGYRFGSQRGVPRTTIHQGVRSHV